MNLLMSIINPFPQGVSLNVYFDYARAVCPFKIKKTDRIFLEDNCINVYRN